MRLRFLCIRLWFGFGVRVRAGVWPCLRLVLWILLLLSGVGFRLNLLILAMILMLLCGSRLMYLIRSGFVLVLRERGLKVLVWLILLSSLVLLILILVCSSVTGGLLRLLLIAPVIVLGLTLRVWFVPLLRMI